MTDLIVAAGGASWEHDVLDAVNGAPGLRVARRCVDAADLLAAARTGAGRRVVVSIDLPGLDLNVVDELTSAGLDVVAVGGEPDRRRAAALGIALVTPAQVTSLGPAPGRPSSVSPGGALWAVLGTAGAPGVSTVSLTLAASTAQSGTDTVLIDLDLRAGSLGQQVSVLDDVSGVLAACRAVTRGRPEEVETHLVEVQPKLRLLTGVPRAESAEHVRPVAVERVLAAVPAEVTVVDCGSSSVADEVTARVLDAAACLVVVGRADPVGLSRLVRLLHALPDGAEPVLLINQMRPGLGWTEREVAATLRALTGQVPDAFVPWDQDSLDRASAAGVAPHVVAGQSAFVAQIDALIARLNSRVP